MTNKWEEYRLFGETLREVGILVGVFVPLDAFFQTPRPNPFLLALGVGAGLLFVLVGIILEAEGRRRLQ